ncbi:protein tramtrack, beta isoform-like isoform X3 [Tigriopus californicus]|uniref:protein tramtrack, beta isoform-like isoform X3 n=1 Tax=Tigriopus californicus TaxID=6832 RepID=UPI0027DAB3F4|nr:protein tramtrack, beta isoform-like isoform X3 [Tigriopus californicus]
MASRCDKPQINPFHPRPPYSHPLFRHLRNLHFSYLNQQRRLPMSSSPPPAPPSSVSERGHQAPPTMVQQQQQQHQQQQQQQQHSQQASQSSSTPTSQGGPTSHNANGGAPSVTSNGQQHYSLKWNNHQSHVLSAFDALLQNESLVDCTLVCDDTNIKAHKVVLSACSPYFQKIFVDNPGKHPIIVLKDVKGWEVQCIVDFMYKGETSVPEAQLQNLIRAAEGLRVRGLTSGGSESYTVEETRNPHVGYGRAFLPSPGAPRFHPHHHQQHPHHPEEHKLHPHPHHHLQSNQSSPMSLTHSHAEDRPRSPVSGSGPRRKQARPRRRSGDSIGNSSLDLSKAESPNSMGFNPHKSPNSTSAAHDDLLPENLSLKRPSSSPAINLVKMESLLEDSQHRRHTAATPSSAMHESEATSSDDIMDRKASPSVSSLSHHMDTRPPPHFHPSLGDHEANARVEALQALNFMAAGGGLPHFPHGHPGLPLPPHTSHMPTPASLAGLTGLTAAAAAASMGRPTSTPVTPSNYSDLIRKRPFSQSQLETVAQLLSVSRSAANQQALMEGHRAAQLFSPFLKGNRPTLTPLPSSTTPGFDIQASEPASPAASTGSGGSGAGSQSHGTSAGFCEICKKHVSNRTNHKYVHSQVKFRCKICGYLYSRKDTLKDHIRGKHNTKFSTQDLNQLVETVTPNANAVTNGNGTVRGSKKNQATKDTLMLNPVLVAAMIPPAPPTSGLVAAKSVETVDLPEESNDEEMEDLEGENNNNVEEGGKSVVELVKAEEQEGEEQEVVNTCGAD